MGSQSSRDITDRQHAVGMTDQTAIEIMEKHKLDAFKYGFIMRDDLEEGGERLGFRQDQLQNFILRGLGDRIVSIESRLTSQLAAKEIKN